MGGDNWPIELRELRYFVTVAELKSFSKAAVLRRIAQPALSRQVRKLEEHLGVELFVRHARGVDLTEAGQLFLRRSYAILRQLEQAREDVVAHAASPTGVVTLGVPPAAGEFLIPALAERMRDAYPGITLRIVEGFSGFIYERLVNHQVSLGILHNPVAHRDMLIEPLLIEQMHLIGPASEQLAGGRPIADLGRLPLILPNRPHSLRLLVENACAESGIRPSIAFDVDSLGISKKMVARGLGYTVLTFGSVYHEVADGALSAAPLTEPGISWTLCMAMRADQARSRALAVTRRLVTEVVHELVDDGVWRGDPRYSEAGAMA
jgi:LysR family transcriptional regulator, nitrogen assimilation regulatory protein